jgi:hypothetical protein
LEISQVAEFHVLITHRHDCNRKNGFPVSAIFRERRGFR